MQPHIHTMNIKELHTHTGRHYMKTGIECLNPFSVSISSRIQLLVFVRAIMSNRLACVCMISFMNICRY